MEILGDQVKLVHDYQQIPRFALFTDNGVSIVDMERSFIARFITSEFQKFRRSLRERHTEGPTVDYQ